MRKLVASLWRATRQLIKRQRHLNVTGHRNLKEVVLYTAAANRKQMAQAATERLDDEMD